MSELLSLSARIEHSGAYVLGIWCFYCHLFCIIMYNKKRNIYIILILNVFYFVGLQGLRLRLWGLKFCRLCFWKHSANCKKLKREPPDLDRDISKREKRPFYHDTAKVLSLNYRHQCIGLGYPTCTLITLLSLSNPHHCVSLCSVRRDKRGKQTKAKRGLVAYWMNFRLRKAWKCYGGGGDSSTSL